MGKESVYMYMTECWEREEEEDGPGTHIHHRRFCYGLYLMLMISFVLTQASSDPTSLTSLGL